MGEVLWCHKNLNVSLFFLSSLSLSLSLSANGCGLQTGAVEGSVWIFYPDKVQDRVALSHALCPAWVKRTHTHTYTQTSACPFTSASLHHHGHLMCLISVLTHGSNCFMTMWKQFVSLSDLWCLSHYHFHTPTLPHLNFAYFYIPL